MSKCFTKKGCSFEVSFLDFSALKAIFEKKEIGILWIIDPTFWEARWRMKNHALLPSMTTHFGDRKIQKSCELRNISLHCPFSYLLLFTCKDSVLGQIRPNLWCKTLIALIGGQSHIQWFLDNLNKKLFLHSISYKIYLVASFNIKPWFIPNSGKQVLVLLHVM